MRTTIARLGLTALLATGGVAVASPAQAAACEGGDGVTVVVEHDGEAQTECAPGDPKTAGEALESAGFAVEKVQSNPEFLCTIDGAPDTSCAEAPEAETFWAFFTAEDGGPWEFAQKGVFALDPKPGTTIGFRFGDGAEPSISAEEAAAGTGSGEESGEESGAGDSSEDAAAASEDAASGESGSNALVTTVAGVGVLAVLAGAAFVVARRRRH